MRSRACIILIFCFATVFFSCKKEGAKQPIDTFSSLSLSSFSVTGQMSDAFIDKVADTILVVVAHGTDMHSVAVNFKVNPGIVVKLNDNVVNSGSTADLSKPFTLTILSSDQAQSISFKGKVQTDLQYFGITGNLVAEKSLNKTYNFYLDQFDGSTYESINCGPTVSTMALKWGDSTFTGTPAGARNQILENGGWWYTSDIQNYLGGHGMQSTIDTIDNLPNIVKNRIDQGNLVILCLDMSYVPYNFNITQHVQKFYPASTTGWGHFLLIKGYRQTSTNFYLEIYDPYSGAREYTGVDNGQLKGKDRYYDSRGIYEATLNWWPYYIATAAPGQPLVASQRLHINSLTKPIPPGKGR